MRALYVIAAFAALAACSSSEMATADAGLADGGSAATVDGGLAGPGSCDLLEPDSCGPGRKCTVLGGEGERTIGCGDDGERGLGEICERSTGGDDCAAGLYCDGSSEPAVCVELCAEEPDSCAAGTVCALAFEVGDDAARICAELCDPVAQDCDRGGFACYPGRKGPSCATVGGGGDTIGEGGGCQYANECAAGLACLRVGQASAWTCLRVCDPFAAEGSCSDTQTCNRIDNEPWGVCITQ